MLSEQQAWSEKKYCYLIRHSSSIRFELKLNYSHTPTNKPSWFSNSQLFHSNQTYHLNKTVIWEILCPRSTLIHIKVIRPIFQQGDPEKKQGQVLCTCRHEEKEVGTWCHSSTLQGLPVALPWIQCAMHSVAYRPQPGSLFEACPIFYVKAANFGLHTDVAVWVCQQRLDADENLRE